MSTKKTASSTGAKPRTSAKPGRNSKGGASAKVGARSKPPTGLKPGAGAKGRTSPVAKTGASRKPGKMEKAIRKNVKDISATIESMAPPGARRIAGAGRKLSRRMDRAFKDGSRSHFVRTLSAQAQRFS
jgi:hypothetical protein